MRRMPRCMLQHIVDAAGCPARLVQAVLAERGLQFVTWIDHRKKGRRDERIIEMRSGGSTLQAIADETGCSHTTVYMVLAKHGHPLSRDIRNRRNKNIQPNSNHNRYRDQKIIALRKKGKTFREIARSVGCSLTTAYEVARKQGLSTTLHRISEDEARQILALRKSGLSLREIGAALGIHWATVNTFLVRNGQM